MCDLILLEDEESNAPTFGGDVDPEKSDKWMRDLERNFMIFDVLDDMKGVVAVPFLMGDVETLWEGAAPTHLEEDEILSWEIFKEAFLDHYFSSSLRMEKEQEFFNSK